MSRKKLNLAPFPYNILEEVKANRQKSKMLPPSSLVPAFYVLALVITTTSRNSARHCKRYVTCIFSLKTCRASAR